MKNRRRLVFMVLSLFLVFNTVNCFKSFAQQIIGVGICHAELPGACYDDDGNFLQRGQWEEEV